MKKLLFVSVIALTALAVTPAKAQGGFGAFGTGSAISAIFGALGSNPQPQINTAGGFLGLFTPVNQVVNGNPNTRRGFNNINNIFRNTVGISRTSSFFGIF